MRGHLEPARRPAALRGAVVAALLAAGVVVQVHFLRRYPQPILFGDPAGYYRVGQRLQEAIGRLSAGEDLGAVFDSVRGTLYYLGVGTLFAVIDGIRPEDWSFFRFVLAGFNGLAMAGTFLLARRLGGSFGAGVAALAVAAVYPSFSVQTGRLYPDPVTGCLFVWAAFFYAEALRRSSPRWMVAAGLALAAALFVRAQIMTYMLLVVALALAASAPFWWPRPPGRRLALALVAALAPVALGWGLIARAVGDRDDISQLGSTTFRMYYPQGFWQLLDTDGWTGPYRAKQDPFYKAMEAEAGTDRTLFRSRPRQVAFTLRYVAARPWQSVLLVLDNAYRLYDRPANDYKWDYPFPYPAQVVLQRVVVVLAVAGGALFVSEAPALAGVFLVPLALLAVHGLTFSWPRYNVPAMPILIAVAGAAAVRLAGPAREALARRPPARRAAVAVVLGAALVLMATLVFPTVPELARVLRGSGLLAVLAAPFLLVVAARADGRTRHLAAAGWSALAVMMTADLVRDRRWHEMRTPLADGDGVEQEIVLSPEGLGSLRAASEAFLVFDLRVPAGDLARATLEVGGQRLPGSSLVPTMPRLRESTSAGGRDWRGYPQWWALPLDPRLLPRTAAEPLRVRLVNEGSSPLVLGGDRFRAQQRVYEGPSFGDWPRLVALKLEYDGDYRIPVTLPLGSLETRSFRVRRGGERTAIRGVHRIRLLTLAGNEGWLDWQSAPLPASPAAVGFAAYSGNRGRAQLVADAAPAFSFPLGAREDFDLREGPFRLCYRAEEPRQDRAYGSYFLVGPVGRPGEPVDLRLRFRTGMSLEPMFFVLDHRRDPAETGSAFARCSPPAGVPVVDGAARVLDATHNAYPTDAGRWSVEQVF